MNHLAHLFLASADADSMAGNLAADWVKGTVGERFTPAIRAAVQMHRQIDAFVDDHPATVRACARLRIGRYGPIVVDVFNDYLLATSWDVVAMRPLEAFASESYSALLTRLDVLPEPLQTRLPRMIGDRWLERFHDLEHISRILRYLSTRLRRPGPVAEGVQVALPHLDGLRADFLDLLPDVVEFARTIDPAAAPAHRVPHTHFYSAF
ncbi:ACP phosphodiesterase [Fimbriimonas ginsengisoli]|uniref:Acyl carrier protein phosphodiesterase n=1 Tax=Fimbriimonas ginsengisoli Gsoil 348 TaxID=661478 RepID=A0A068NVQ4_FIMGI|nr:ACP phosphodiesterase [Fimbriimonas ginsengisoli]AIE85674.1 Acyl carrier protein phosphodiesterase [Fimbriimonas ginsengisoli Gsoil 348]